MSPVDVQKQRLYDAERLAFGGEWADVRVSRQAQKCLVHDADNGSHTYPSVDATQAYVDAIRTSAQFQRRWGFKSLTVVANWGGTSRGGGGILHMAPAHRVNEAFILHEIAHNLISYHKYAAHGPEFAATLHELVKLFMGKTAAADLRAAFAAKKVKYFGDKKVVPEPSEARYARAREVKVKHATPGKPIDAERFAARKANARKPMTYESSYRAGRQSSTGDPSVAMQCRAGFDGDAYFEGYLDESAGREMYHLRDCQAHHNDEGGCGVA